MTDVLPGRSVHEIDSSIKQHQHLLSMLSRFDPLRPRFLFALALEEFDRHILSNQREDLDKAIVHFTESILLSWLQPGPFILRALYFLANALVFRPIRNVSKQPEDTIYVAIAAKYLFHLRNQPHEVPDIPRHEVTTFLVRVLALQVELKAGNVMQNIREIAVLSLELLTSDTPDVDTTGLVILIHEVVELNISVDVPDQPLDQLIMCLQAARKHRPDLLKCRLALAQSLICRYNLTGVDDDYEEAASILDEIITNTSPENNQDKSVSVARGLAAVLAMARSLANQKPEDLEEAIYRTHTSFGSSSINEHHRPVSFGTDITVSTAEQRYRLFGSIEGVEAPSGDSRLSLLAPETSELSQALHKMENLLFGIRNNDDTTKMDEAVEKGRSILASSSPDALLFYMFGKILNKAFWRANRRKIEYLNEMISVRRQFIKSPAFPHVLRFREFPELSMSLFARSQLFPAHRMQDLDEALDLLSQYVSDAHGDFPDRLMFACKWADIARRYRHSSVSTAYKTAESLMQDALLFSPTLQLQHASLATHSITHSLPLDYASYWVENHQLKEAIETLERGRALLWSEMRYLRTSIDQLLVVNPDLGHKFAAVNRDLEELTKSVPPSHKLTVDDAAADGLRAVDPFGRLVLKQRGILKERAKLISQIQALPNFDGFLASPSFDTLRSAAVSGPVIIINHSTCRSDIIVLLHDRPPSLILTPHDFYKRASTLKDNLLVSRRKYGLSSEDYDKTLSSVLKELYELVGKPVIDRLRQLQVPEQSRIWWCPTSVFCSLPLHAMGPIRSDDGELCYFLDLYICSYTPTLAALIQSRHHNTGLRSSDRPSMLLVAQIDPSLPTVPREIQTVQALDTKVTSLISEAAIPATVINSFHHHQFVHFACHGTLKDGEPFEAGFKLHGGTRLTILEIVRAHLPAAEFAFLSACHTAEVTEGSILDEGLHLAAAVQYCGFRSVVGTMWEMVDEDGQELAKDFYKALFSDPRGSPYYERSAEALQCAVKKLRRKLRRKSEITLERWVNFVHYGA